MNKLFKQCFWFCFTMIAFHAFGQNQVIPMQSIGHTKLITTLAFWEDEKWFATGGTDKLIKIWDTRTLKEITTLEGHNFTVGTLTVFEKNNEKIIVSGGINELKVWNATTSELVKNIYINEHVIALTYIDASNKIYLATKRKIYELDVNNLKTRFLFQLNEDIVDFKVNRKGTLFFAATKKSIHSYNDRFVLQKSYSLEKIDNLYELSINDEGNRIVAAGLNFIHYWNIIAMDKFEYKTFSDANASGFYNDNNDKIYARKYQESVIYAYDAKGKKSVDSLEVPPNMINLFSIRLSPTKKYLAGFGYNQIMLWDVASSKKINEYNKAPNSINTFTHHHNFLAVSIASKGKIAVFDWEKCLLTEINNAQKDRVNYLYFDSKDQLIAHAQDGSVSTNSIEQQKSIGITRYFEKEEKKDNQSNMSAFLSALSKNVMYEVDYNSQNQLFAFTGDNNLYLYNLGEKVFTDTLYGHLDLIKSIQFNEKKNKILTSSLDKTARIWDLNSSEKSILIGENRERLFTAVFSADEDYVFTGAADGNVKMFDATSGKLVRNIGLFPNEIKDLAIDTTTKELIITSKNNLFVYDVDSQLKRKLFQSNIDLQKTLQLRDNLYAVLLKNETIVFVDKEKGEIGTLIFSNEEKTGFVFYTPDGYYMGDQETVRNNIHFILKNKVFLFEQFDLHYNRPDLILERLGCTDSIYINGLKKAFEKRVEKLGYSIETFDKKPNLNVPELKLENTSFYQTTKDKFYSATISARDVEYSLQKIHVIINGIPLFSEKGKTTTLSKEISEIIDFELSTGDNIVDVFVENTQGVKSLRERFVINFTSNKTMKPNLFLVTLGASKYVDGSMNLKYASKDGDDIISLFNKNADTYQKINTLQIKNENVTIESLTKIENFISKASVEDIVLFFISGHGVFDANYNYYLATHDIDFLNPAQRGIPYSMLENLLSKSKSRNKVLFLDACHSGEIDKDEVEMVENVKVKVGVVTFRNFGQKTIQSSSKVGLYNSFELQKQLFTDLRANNGTNVVSASGGTEFAMEGNDWKNGVFTYAFLSGITEKTADINKDGYLMLSEIQEYVEESVFKLTNGRQKPTSRVKNLVHDFHIWKY